MTLSEVVQNILLIYRDYIGTGMMAALFILSVVYLFFEEKEISRKLILVVLSLTIVALFACPLFAWIVYQYLDEEVYYRILWLLPVSTVIAYTGVKVLLRVSGVKRIVVLLGLSGMIMVCGDYTYDSQYFTVAENPYHVPDAVVKICDEIRVEGQTVCAVFPLEMIQYVWQYAYDVYMPYGREMIVGRWNFHHELYDVYEEGAPDGVVQAEILADKVRENSVQYIIWNDERHMDGNLADWGFVLENQIDGYSIYKDEEYGVK